MVDRNILYKIKPAILGQNVADATDVEVVATGFDGNLTNTITDVQALADAVDDLVLGSGQLTTEQVQDIVGGMLDQNTGVVYDDVNGEVDLPATAQLDSLFNGGSTILAGTPVIAFAHTDGTLRMSRATTSNVGHNLGVGLDENQIYGFVTENVTNGMSSTPIRQGLIAAVDLLASNNSPGQRLIIRQNGGNLQLSDIGYTSSDYASFAGFVVDAVLTGNTDMVYVSLDYVIESRASRLESEVDGKENGLGNPSSNGQVLASTTTGTRSWVDAGAGGGGLTAVGTPTDGQYSQWASSTSLRGLDGIPSADIVLDEVLLQTDGLISVPNETAYDTYANRRVLFRHSVAGNVQEKIFQLPQTIVREGAFNFIRTGDFFEIVNDSTVNPLRTMTVRAFSSAESIGGTSQSITLQPNEFIRLEIPPFGLARWAVVSRGFVSGAGGVSGQAGSSMSTATVTSNRPDYEIRPWTNGTDGTAYHSGNVHVERIDTILADNVINHLTSPADGNNPVSVVFDDDQAMIAWWQHIIPTQPALELGSDYYTINENIAAGVSWIDANIGVGYDFELNHPEITDLAIESFSYVAGTEVRVHIEDTGLNLQSIAGFNIGRPIRISGAANPDFNGDFSLTSVSTTHFQISSLDFGTGDDETDTPATLNLIWYGDVVTASSTSRQYNFNLYYNAARSVPANFLSTHFDPDVDINTVDSALDVPFARATELTPQITLEDSEGNTHYVSSGTLHNIHTIDNGNPSVNPFPASDAYESERSIPEGSPIIHVRTEANLALRLPSFDTVPVGQSRQYRVFSDPLNGSFEVVVTNQVGGNSFAGRILAMYIPNGQHCDFEMFNDGFNVGSRVITPIDKIQSSRNLWDGSGGGTAAIQTATSGNTTPLPTTSNNLAGGINQDPSFYFFNPNNGVGAVRLYTEGTSYEFKTRVDVLFNGVEPTGLQFVEITLMPRLKITALGQTAFTDLPEFANTSQLILSRSGQSGSSAPKARGTVFADFRHVSRVNDEIEFDLRITNLPTGVTLGDFQLQNFQFSRQAKRGFI